MKIHVVSFQVPFPADYGGAIDVFYKLKWLREQGHDICLHTYIYGDRKPSPELDKLCSNVFYYKRQTGWCRLLSTEPYIANSRRSTELLENLCRDSAPILFEGLHTCHFLLHPRLRGRLKIVRMHNIEHDYYSLLARQVRWGWRNIYYRTEAWKLRRFEKVLAGADRILAISQADAESLRKRFPQKSVVLLPCFYDDTCVPVEGGTRPYVLYQGNLKVEENVCVANFIQDQLAPQMPDCQFVIAGRSPVFSSRCPNVAVVANPSDEEMTRLLAQARVNLLLTFQPTGIKLKLLSALSKSRGHVVANREMLQGNDLGELCTTVSDLEALPQLLKSLLEREPNVHELNWRQDALKRKKARISRLSLFE